MKIWKKRMAMILMFLCLFLMAGLAVSAAGSRVLRLRNGRTYRADLDGNGKNHFVCNTQRGRGSLSVRQSGRVVGGSGKYSRNYPD